MKMKIAKMVKGVDSTDKYKDFDELVKKYDNASLNAIADELVKWCIMRNKYYFDGNYHQYGDYGSFVFEDEDGEQYLWMASMRYFGDMMADVWSKLDRKRSYDYMDFYMLVDERDPMFHVPKSETEFLEKMGTNYSVHCEKCGKDIMWDEYVVNFGWCEKCLDDDYRQYMEEVEKHKEETNIIKD